MWALLACHLKPARQRVPAGHTWLGYQCGIGPAQRRSHCVGMRSRSTLPDRSAAYQPAVHRGEQLATGLIQAWICPESVDHAAGRLTGRRGVAEKPSERVRLQAEELFKPGDGRRIGRPTPFLPLPHGGRCATDSSGHSALREARVHTSLAQRVSESLALSASAVHRPSIPDLLVAVQTSLAVMRSV